MGKVTAETITREQILRLADDYALLGQSNDVTDCYIALGPSDMFWGGGPSPEATQAARVRCAAAWNARHGGG